MKKKNSLSFMISLVLSLFLLGTVGYKVLLDVGFLDAMYMTVITISTVGYAEVAEMDNEAKIFSIFLIFISLGTVGYLFSSIMSSLLEGDLKLAWRRNRMERDILNLKDHYIICGAGESGINAIKQFQKSNVDFIVIEKNEEKIKGLIEDNIPVIHGDSTHEPILEKARISLAKGLISTLPNDADKKLKRARADNTISPNEIGGNRMAALMLRPTVISFLDIMTHVEDVVLDLENVTVIKGSSIDDKTLREAKIPEKTGLIILAIKKKKDDKWIFNPNSNELLKAGDSMVVLGTYEQVDKLRNL